MTQPSNPPPFPESEHDRVRLDLDPRGGSRSVPAHILEIRRWAVELGLSGHLAETLEYDTSARKQVMRDALLTLRGEVLSNRLPPDNVTKTLEFAVEVPASWWQHLKHQYNASRWLGWLSRLFPVRMDVHRQDQTIKISLQRFHNYPEAPAALGRYAGVRVSDYEMEVAMPTTAITWKDKS